jgi:LPS sulfotransferase NodH
MTVAVFNTRVQNARVLRDLDANGLRRLRRAVEHEIVVHVRAQQDVAELLGLLDAIEARLWDAKELEGERPPTLERRQQLAVERGR